MKVTLRGKDKEVKERLGSTDLPAKHHFTELILGFKPPSCVPTGRGRGCETDGEGEGITTSFRVDIYSCLYLSCRAAKLAPGCNDVTGKPITTYGWGWVLTHALKEGVRGSERGLKAGELFLTLYAKQSSGKFRAACSGNCEYRVLWELCDSIYHSRCSKMNTTDL
uniref:Uncharacterized protein n=1 Tax=Timema tahoe TaxID=61484 RepID=A0A7R9NZJ6_9NEOP|nr:unnamed protein product [Timema tahoe]